MNGKEGRAMTHPLTTRQQLARVEDRRPHPLSEKMSEIAKRFPDASRLASFFHHQQPVRSMSVETLLECDSVVLKRSIAFGRGNSKSDQALRPSRRVIKANEVLEVRGQKGMLYVLRRPRFDDPEDAPFDPNTRYLGDGTEALQRVSSDGI
jgi:hypothetical protein